MIGIKYFLICCSAPNKPSTVMREDYQLITLTESAIIEECETNYQLNPALRLPAVR
jgi:hypothetical protein